MWRNSKALLGVLPMLLVAACASTTSVNEFAWSPQPIAALPDEVVALEAPRPNNDPWERPPWAAKPPKGKENTVFEIEPTTNAGVFHGFLRNDEGLFSAALHARFMGLLDSYCKTKAVMVHDVVIITADQRWPSHYTDGLFRCEAARK